MRLADHYYGHDGRRQDRHSYDPSVLRAEKEIEEKHSKTIPKKQNRRVIAAGEGLLDAEPLGTPQCLQEIGAEDEAHDGEKHQVPRIRGAQVPDQAPSNYGK